jgi:small subunit ribosomal protein S3Ae
MPKKRITTGKERKKRKEKKWFKVLASPEFDEKPIGEALTNEASNLIGNRVEISLQEITGNLKQTHIKLRFKIKEVANSEAKTQFVGHSLTSDYVRRLTRKGRKKIDSSFEVETKKGVKMQIKPFVITYGRIQTSKQKAFRELIEKEISKFSKEREFDEFIKAMLSSELATHCYGVCKHISPLRRIEIWKSEVIPLVKD